MPLNIPNLLTWARILLIPLFVGVFYAPLHLLAPAEQNLAATVIFVAAAITDWLDGWLARRVMTVGKEITPSTEEYAGAADYLVSEMRRKRSRHPVGRLVESFRIEYYRLVKEYLVRREQIILCYAGWASAQIAPDGYVWGCCIRAESVGGLRENGYDFGKIWFSERPTPSGGAFMTKSVPARSPTSATRTC